MRWVYRNAPISEEAIRAAISRDGMRAGWAPEGKGTSDWVWIAVTEREWGTKYRRVRDCTEEEKAILNDLLGGEIVCRMVRDSKGTSWALASID